MHTSPWHSINGHRVDSLHHDTKCGVVFYRFKGESPRLSRSHNEAYNIIKAVECGHAQKYKDDIAVKLDEGGIKWTGFTVIKSSDLRFEDTFSTKTVYVERHWSECISNFSLKKVSIEGVKVILLLQ